MEKYRLQFGRYPEAVIVDKIYRNRDNIQYCKSYGNRLSGQPSGRPAIDKKLLKEQYGQEKQDTGIRNCDEGKFGEAKRVYGLNRIMTRLFESSKTVIACKYW